MNLDKHIFQICFNIMSPDSDEDTKRTNLYRLIDVVNAANKLVTECPNLSMETDGQDVELEEALIRLRAE